MALCGYNAKAVPTCPLGVYSLQPPSKSALRPHYVNIGLETKPPPKERQCLEESDSSSYSDSDSDLDFQDDLPVSIHQYSTSEATDSRNVILKPKLLVNRAKTAGIFSNQGFNKIEVTVPSGEGTTTSGRTVSNHDKSTVTLNCQGFGRAEVSKNSAERTDFHGDSRAITAVPFNTHKSKLDGSLGGRNDSHSNNRAKTAVYFSNQGFNKDVLKASSTGVINSRAKTAGALGIQGFHKMDVLAASSGERTTTPGWGIGDSDRVRPTSISMDRSLHRYRWLHSAPSFPRKGLTRMAFMTELGEIQLKPKTCHYPDLEKTEKKSIPTHLYTHSVNDVISACQKALARSGQTTKERQLREQEADEIKNNLALISGNNVDKRTVLELLLFGGKSNKLEKLKDVEYRRKRHRRYISDEKDTKDKNEFQALKTFQMAAWTVLRVVRVMAGIIANTNYKTIRSAAEQQWHILYSSLRSHNLAFNKDFYTRERAITKMPVWALKILDKRPDERTTRECRRIQVLLKGMRSFDKFTEKLQMSLCKAFSLDRVSEGRVILRQGHIGQNFYLVYSGSVFVNVNDVTSAGESFTKTEAVLSRGDSFGELALLKDITRTATIAVRENCELLVVNKTVFSKVCPKIFERELEEKELILRRSQLFASRWWTDTALKNICLEAYVQEYPTNQVIVANSQYEDWIYICVEGKCDVIRCLELKSKARLGPRFNRRRSTVILSDEIIDLLESFRDSKQQNEEESESDGEETKQSVYKEVEENEKKKAFQAAATGQMSLTTFMKDRLRTNGPDIVFLHVGVLQANEVFDLSCILSYYDRTHSSPLTLVSCGAKILKIHREKLYEFATESSLEYIKGLASNYERYPSDASLLCSYKRYSNWKAYRMDLVNQIKQPGFRKCTHRKSTFEPPKCDELGRKRRLKGWQCLDILTSRVVKKKEPEKPNTDEERPKRIVRFGRPVFDLGRNEWQPEIERTVPENIVLRRESQVGIPRRPSLVVPTVTLPRKQSRRQNSEEISQEEEEVEEEEEPENCLVITGRRKSVSIKTD